MSVTRERLYEEVWAEPMTTVAGRYGVSSNYLARVCERLDVPRPPRGYWAKLKVGKASAKPPIPEAGPACELEWFKGAPIRRRHRTLPKAPEPGARRKRTARERPARHPLLVGVREHFEAGRLSESGYLRPRKRILVDVFVSKERLERALDVASEFFLSLEDRAHTVALSPRDVYYQRPELYAREGGKKYDYWHREPWSPDRTTIVFIGTVAIGLTVYEVAEEVEFRYLKGEYVRVSDLPPTKRPYDDRFSWISKKETPSGCLAIRAYSPYSGTSWQQTWRESKPGELAGKFRAIAKALEEATPAIANLAEEGMRKAEEESRRWRAQMREHARQEREKRRQEALKESRQQLLAIVEAWSLARDVEGFFEDALRRAGELENDEQTALTSRLAEARELLGGVSALGHFAAWRSPEDRVGRSDDSDHDAERGGDEDER